MMRKRGEWEEEGDHADNMQGEVKTTAGWLIINKLLYNLGSIRS